jgi:hypothetical protein
MGVVTDYELQRYLPLLSGVPGQCGPLNARTPPIIELTAAGE